MGEIKLPALELQSFPETESNRSISKNALHDVRCGVWFLASELYGLDDLQLFAETVVPTDPLDIRQTAQILAKAQLELRALINNLYSPSRSQ